MCAIQEIVSKNNSKPEESQLFEGLSVPFKVLECTSAVILPSPRLVLYINDKLLKLLPTPPTDTTSYMSRNLLFLKIYECINS